ncbi:MAG: helix-turn-helix domain-containing protein [Parvularculaceae bacterium]|nr:helix-turn-helix transcriptional regulator [Parvularculaceae bacterium]
MSERGKEPRARSRCPISRTLELVGDRWTLVILRDLFIGKKRYGEFLDSPERITTNILANRLDLIERAGLATRRAYQHRPARYEYELTEKGRDMFPVLYEMSRWANKHYPETFTPPDSFTKAGMKASGARAKRA